MPRKPLEVRAHGRIKRMDGKFVVYCAGCGVGKISPPATGANRDAAVRSLRLIGWAMLGRLWRCPTCHVRQLTGQIERFVGIKRKRKAEMCG